jgi:beta-fructofuranosidase
LNGSINPHCRIIDTKNKKASNNKKEISMTQKATTDRTSRVPRFTFADSLEAQEKQLAENPLIQRFRESRRTLAADPYRPIYHFVSPESYLNDPNGLCFWQGRWHLFYQGYPPEDLREHWGHAVSDDLIHWRDLPYAIYPNPENRCYSGSTLVEEDRVIAMYNGTQAGNMIAISRDPLLLNWEKLTGKAVIPLSKVPSPDDCCIWKKDGLYYSLTKGMPPYKPSIRRRAVDFLYRSSDLVTWEYLHPFVEGDMFSVGGDDRACPYFLPIGDRHILLFFSHRNGSKYLLGDYDTRRDKFVVTHGDRFTFGFWHPGGLFAPSASPDGQGGVVAIFAIKEAKPTPGWNEIMSLPRRLILAGKDELAIEPIGDIESLRYRHQWVEPMQLPANREVVLDGVQGNALEIVTEIDPMNASMIELNILRSPGKEEFTRIAFYNLWGYQKGERTVHWARWLWGYDSVITLDMSYASELPDVASRAPETTPVYLPEATLKLRVFIDKSVVEVFVNNRQCIAARVYPGRADSLGVSLRAQGGEATLKSFDAWTMKSIYTDYGVSQNEKA